MKMANGVNVRPRAKDLAVQINLGGRPQAGGARYDRAVEITDQKIARPNCRATLLERLYNECVTIGQPGRDMTAVAKDIKIVEQQSRGGDLVPKILFTFLHFGFLHFKPILVCYLEQHRIVASSLSCAQAVFLAFVYYLVCTLTT